MRSGRSARIPKNITTDANRSARLRVVRRAYFVFVLLAVDEIRHLAEERKERVISFQIRVRVLRCDPTTRWNFMSQVAWRMKKLMQINVAELSKASVLSGTGAGRSAGILHALGRVLHFLALLCPCCGTATSRRD